MRYIFIVFLLIINFQSLIAEQKSESINIAALILLTGDFAFLGEAFNQGIELAVEEINSQGGINNRKINLLVEDTSFNSKKAHIAAKKVIALDSVMAGVTSTYTEVMTIGPVFTKAKTPIITINDSSEEIEKISDYTFAIGTWVPSAGEESAIFAVNKLASKRAAVIHNINPWSEATANFFKEKYESLGGQVVSLIGVNPEETDFKTILTKVKSTKADVIFAPITSNPFAFFKQKHQIIPEIKILTCETIDDGFIKQGPEYFEGAYKTSMLIPENGRMKKLRKLYLARYGQQPDYPIHTAKAYDSIWLIAEAIKMGAKTPEEVKENLYKVKNYQGASSLISINSKGTSRSDVSIFQVKKGKIVHVPTTS